MDVTSYPGRGSNPQAVSRARDFETSAPPLSDNGLHGAQGENGGAIGNADGHKGATESNPVRNPSNGDGVCGEIGFRHIRISPQGSRILNRAARQKPAAYSLPGYIRFLRDFVLEAEHAGTWT